MHSWIAASYDREVSRCDLIENFNISLDVPGRGFRRKLAYKSFTILKEYIFYVMIVILYAIVSAQRRVACFHNP